MRNSFFTCLLLLAIISCGTQPIFSQCPITLSAGDDIYLCSPPTPTQLDGSISGDYLNFTWSPTAGLSGASTLSPTATVTQTTTYVLTARAVDLSTNLINNGDFEGGDGGFTSSYTHSPGNLWPEGVYEVTDDPQQSHTNFASCGDHTSGNGQMMAVNGNGTPNQSVWCQTVTVLPNTQYAFTAWATSLVGAAPAILQFSVNGTNLGTSFGVSPQLCTWQPFYALWNSGGNTSASICIVNQNTALSGNDFALDDIGFSPICTVTDTVKVHVVNVAAVASPSSILIPCEGANINLSGVGSTTGTGITYQWDSPSGNIVSGANTLNPVVDQAGVYTLTVTYSIGNVECTKTATSTVIPTPNPLATWISPPQPLGCGGNNTTLVGNSSQANVSYSWSTISGNIVSGSTSKNCVVSETGEYTLLVTNLATGCTAETAVFVTAATNPPTSNAVATGVITCVQNAAILSGTGSSTGANITYTWSAFPGGSFSGPQNTQNTTVNSAGTYVLSVRNTINGCIALDTVVVTGNTVAPSVAIAAPPQFTCVVDTITLVGSSTPANLNYTWSSPNGTFAGATNAAQIQTIANGMYILQATNPVNGCISRDTVLVTSNLTAPVAVALPAGMITCQQNSVVLSGVGSSSGANMGFAWNGPGIVTGINTLNPTVNAAGNYTLVVTNNTNGCTQTATTNVQADANAITAIANAPDTLDCNLNSMVLNANGSSSGTGFTYVWTTTNGQISAGDNTPQPTINAPGTYQLLLTNPASGCTSIDQVVVIQDIAQPSVAIQIPDTLTCAQPNINVIATNNAAGNYAYQWSTTNGTITSGTQGLNLSVSAPGNYNLLVTNLLNGCSMTSATTVVQEAGLPVVQIQTPDTLSCTLNTLPINANTSSSGMQITWTTSNGGQIVSGQNSLTPIVDKAGTYTLLLTNNNNGCTATGSIQVASNQILPPADAGVDGLITCTNPQWNLLANNASTAPNITYLWQTSNGVISGNPAAASLNINNAGTYYLLVTDTNNSCTARDTVVITANQTPPNTSPLVPQVLTCTTQSTSLGLSAINPLWNYNWQTANGNIQSGNQTPTPLVNAPGNYATTVTNPANGCSTILTIPVIENITPPTLLLSAPIVLTCQDPIGAITANANTNLLQWSTTNGHFTSTNLQQAAVNVDEPGTYNVVATNSSNGCTTDALLVITENKIPPTIAAGNDAVLNCQSTSLSLNGSASVGTNVMWTTSNGLIVSGMQSLTPVVNKAGTYIVTATDPTNGCTATDQVVITNDANAPTAAIAPAQTLTCTLLQTTLNGTGTQGAGINYNWQASNGGTIQSGSNTLTPVVNNPGNYTLTVTNTNNGCTVTATVVVNENVVAPQVSATAPKITCLDLSPNLQTTAVPTTNLLWTTTNGQILNGANTPTPEVGSAGTYTVTGTNPQNGCTSTALVVVVTDTISPIFTVTPPSILTCTVLELPITANLLQPNNFALQWTTTNGQIVSGAQSLQAQVNKPGTYSLKVTNNTNGCSKTIQTIVNQNITPPTATTTPTATINCNQAQPTLSATASPASNYAWSGPQIINGGNTLTPTIGTAGTYILTVTLPSNGCTTTATVNVVSDIATPVIAIALPEVLTCVRVAVPLIGSVQSPASPNYTLSWSSPNGNFVVGQNTLSPSVDEPGDYILSVKNNLNGCSDDLQITVNQNIVPPVANAGTDQILHCNQQEVGLQAFTSNNLTYNWQTGAGGNIVQGNNSATPTVNQPGTYTLKVTDTTNGCTNTDNVVVTEIQLPDFEMEMIQPDCNQPTGVIDITSLIGAGDFQISFNGGQQFGIQQLKENLPPATYTVVIKDKYGCTATQNAVLLPPTYPTVSLPETYKIELGDSVQLVPQTTPPAINITKWQWTEVTDLDCTNCPKPYASPLSSSNYALTITDLDGCTASAQTRVEVDKKRYVYAPNIFTPDGKDNNRFLIFGRGVLEIQNLSVFDRWGEMVFLGTNLAPNDESAGWDGRVGNKNVAPGVYVWQALIVFPDGKVELYSGDVTVAR